MMLRRALVLALALAALLVALIAARPARADVARPVHQQRLANGLRLVVAPDASGVEVSVLVTYDTGARDEPAGLEGLAHLVEHLMFLGSRHVPPGAFARALEQAGTTNLNGVTTLDGTRYFETLPPERLELALWLESDRMGYGLDRLDEATLARAKAEVLNERRERVVETPLGGVTGMMYAQLFPEWHPYHHLPVGDPTSIARITLADARAFVSTWYGPANAVVVIAGNVEPAAAAALVERYFGTLPPRAPPVRPPLPALTSHVTRLLTVGASVTRSEVRLAWVTPAFGAPGDAELDLAAAILVNRGAGWLEKLLFRAPRLCSNIVIGQRSLELASVFEINATVADGVGTREVMTEVLHRIRLALEQFDQGVADADIQRARVGWQTTKLFGLESTLGRAESIRSAMQLGPLADVFGGQGDRFTNISPAAVRSAVHTFLGWPWAAVLATPTLGKPLSGEILAYREVSW
jgi:zinc protease